MSIKLKVIDEGLFKPSRSYGSDELSPEDAERNQRLKRLKIENFGRLILFPMNILIVVGYIVVVLVIVFQVGNQTLSLSDGVLMTLLGTTTANVIGLLLVVTKSLFPNNDRTTDK